jgi:hypothetical protein
MAPRHLLAGLFLLALAAAPARAQNGRGVGVSPAGVRRVALVIGNGAYRNAPRLANPVNDARDVAALLRSLGFEVIAGEDQSAEQMKRLAAEFGERLAREGGVGLFYYAGHGVQVGGRNYLLPVEAGSLRERTIEFDAFDRSATSTRPSVSARTGHTPTSSAGPSITTRRITHAPARTFPKESDSDRMTPGLTAGGPRRTRNSATTRALKMTEGAPPS